ncbi:hypothetical protein [Streptomyces sp. NPDC058773]|uniref:hypothetical protein n=1 Tax=Streptomyces sp. NPDC058773 TaxID=3346632 RepID=UPI0036A44AF8
MRERREGGDAAEAAGDGAAFEASLRAAEALLSSVRRREVRLLTLRMLQGVSVLLLPAVAYALAGPPLWPVLAAVAWAVAVVIEIVVTRPVRRLLVKERAVLSGMVSMLREVFVRVSRKEKWEAARVRGTRERLARFSIEERGFWWIGGSR